MNSGEQSFSTSEAILAYCLYLSGCEFVDDRTPCSNLFDEEILGKLGYRGETLINAAEQAWRAQEKGHVQWHFKLTPRCADLIRAYREQCKDMEAQDCKASEMVGKIRSHEKTGAILADEALLRESCVILKTRGEFMNMFKKLVPLLRIPIPGKSRHFNTTARKGNRTVAAQGVEHPGFNVISLNLSKEKREKML